MAHGNHIPANEEWTAFLYEASSQDSKYTVLPAKKLGLVLQHRQGRASWVLHLQEGAAVELARLLVRYPLDEHDAWQPGLQLLFSDFLVEITAKQTSYPV